MSSNGLWAKDNFLKIKYNLLIENMSSFGKVLYGKMLKLTGKTDFFGGRGCLFLAMWFDE